MELDHPASGLRWSREGDPHVTAALALLATHGYWPAREDFFTECVHVDGDGTAWIGWQAARRFAEDQPQASSSQLAILRLAVALATDQYRLSRTSVEEGAAIIRAVATATGMEAMLHA